MIPTAIRKRKKTTSALSTVKGKPGDLVVDTTKNTVVVMDGTTSGGTPLAVEAHTHPNATPSVPGFMSAADKTSLNSLVIGGSTPGTVSSASTANTIVGRDASANFAANIITATLNGNATTATNGIVSSGSYANPAWITSLAASKLTGTLTIQLSGGVNLPWAQITGKPTIASAVSQLTNDSGFITNTGTTTGAAGSVTGQTASPTANKVIVRDSSGRAQVASPSASGDIANKAYVDASSSSGNNKQVYATPGTYTWVVPSTVNYVDLVLIGAGGSGSGGFVDGSSYGGNGGNGAGFGRFKGIPVTPGSSITVVCGAGGIANVTPPSGGVATNEILGTTGGASSFGTINIPGGGYATPTAVGGISNPGFSGTKFSSGGENLIIGGGYGFPGAGGGGITGGGGGAAAYSIATADLAAQIGGAWAVLGVGGAPFMVAAVYGVGNGGSPTGSIAPGVGGGGGGGTYTSSGYIAGQNGGPGLVLITW